ncbi:hypothetical protein J7E79_00360 [Bacillus sp. ISL-40]|uniref:hypothetical protein n=1 Tax=unclassified Bacillus (in: firmicutes) TaxID=185979 RepID=UPI001BEBA0F9|nr:MULTISPECIES: hypothetical protein [unclassified Bacillus (in: firmicutes)]MBT2695900.1 hypothetical protein [Bacillus sp. ISL-40]MBT2739744.1 hypothetical protein [Bacillus sp. ISL-77]
MDKLAGETQSNQPYFNHFFEQIKSLMSNLDSAEQPSPSVSSASNLPLQTIGTVSMANMKAAFMAFADAVIPSTLGALDLRLDDYIVWTLDHFVSIQGEWGIKSVPLSFQTARMLDIAALQLMVSGNIKVYPDYSANPDGGPFAALSLEDRFEAIRLLEDLQVDLEVLPPPYRNNAGLVKNIVTSLHQMVMFGYYSEWFSLGSTRLAYPEDHRLERPQFLWDMLDYPGPSFGYREVRGYLVDKFSE